MSHEIESIFMGPIVNGEQGKMSSSEEGWQKEEKRTGLWGQEGYITRILDE